MCVRVLGARLTTPSTAPLGVRTSVPSYGATTDMEQSMQTKVDRAAARRLDRTVSRAGESLAALRRAFYADVNRENDAAVKAWLGRIRVGAAIRRKEASFIALGGRRAMEIIDQPEVCGTVERVHHGRKHKGVWMRTPSSSILVWVDVGSVRYGHATIEGSPFPTLLKEREEWDRFLGHKGKA